MKTNFTLSTKIFTIILFSLLASITNGYAQESGTDGDYCPAPGINGEYDTGTVFSQMVDPNASSTCEIYKIWAKIYTDPTPVTGGQVLKLGLKIGNSGAALFRVYIDTDDDPTSGLTLDQFGGPLTVAGAEFILELNAKTNAVYTLYKSNDNGTNNDHTTITPIPSNGSSATNGDSNGCAAGDGKFLEFNIPFESIGFDICDPNSPGLITITKLASVSGGSPTSARCIDIPLTFGIPLTGTVTANPATVCAGNNTILNAVGIPSTSTVDGWEYSTNGGSNWLPINPPSTNNPYTTANLSQTTQFRAVIKDISLCTVTFRTSAVTVIVNPKPTVTITNPAAVCSPSTVDLTLAAVTAGSTAGLTYTYWTNAGATISYPTPTTAGAGTYYIKGTTADGCFDIKPVTVTVNPKPTVTITDPTAVCSPSTVNLTLPAVTAGSTAGLTYTYWTNAGATISYPTPTTAGAGTYYIKGTTAAGCFDIKPVTVTVNPSPNAPTSGGNQTVCETSPIQTLTATATGGTITWYTAASGGTLVANPTLNIVGTVTYYAQASNGTCSSLTRTAVILTINAAPAAPTSGGNQTVCEALPIQTLTATATGGTITWFTAATGGSPISSPTLNTVGTVTYYAQTSNGICSSLTRTAVTLTINAAPAAPTSGGNQTVCEADPIQTLTATVTGGIITWYTTATGGTLVASPTLNTIGSVTYYAQASNGTCSSLTRTAVTLTINAAPAAPTSGGNQTVCEASPIQTLTAAATGGTITWYTAAAGGSVVANPTLNTIGSVTYYAQASNGTCSSLTRTAVTLTIIAAPAAPTSGGNQTVCELDPIQTLTATAIVAQDQSIVWYNSATDGEIVEDPTLNTLGTVTYYAQAVNNSSSCISLTRTPVILTINACSITITKDGAYQDTTAPIGTANPGDIVTYDFVVTNTGNVPLTNVFITDLFNNVTITGGPISLAVDASDSTTFKATYTITQTDIDTGFVYNLAEVSGTPPTGPPVMSTSTDPTPCTTCPKNPECTACTITPIPQTPSIAIVKGNDITIGENGCAILEVGDMVTYTFTVTNPGNVSLHNVIVLDPLKDLSAIALQSGDSNNNNILEITETWIYTATYTVTQADIDAGNITNQASVNGTAPDTTIVTDLSGDSETDDLPNDIPICTSPKIVIVKANDIEVGENGCAILEVGDVVTYTFTVSNPGNVSLHNVIVFDPLKDLSAIALQSGDSNNNNILEVTETWIYTATYTVTQADIDAGNITNQASVNGTAPDTTIVADLSGDSETDDLPNEIPICASPKIVIVKANDIEVGPDGCAILEVGDVVTYTFTLSNPGNVSLHTVTVADPHIGLSTIALQSGDTNGNNILEVTETWVYTATYAVTQADIDAGQITNQASVSATAPDDSTVGPVLSGNSATDNNPNIIPICSLAKIALVKTAVVGGNGGVGDIITYTFAVTNLGNVTITNIVVTDPLVGLTITNSPITSLAPGATDSSVKGTYTITQADIDAGGVTNSALAVGQDPKGNDVKDISGTTVENDTPTVTTLTQNPGLAVIKTSNTPFYSSVGDIINYSIEVKNTGNVTLYQITVKDPLTGLNTIIESLAPGSSRVYTQNYTVTQSDRVFGSVTNVATADGFTPNETPINASDTEVVDAAIVLGCGSITVHNAFSPNGDGINETFIIDNIDDILCYPNNTVEIYNRWGVLVFETNGYDNVNKVFRGYSEGRTTISQSSGLPTGTYYYILNYTSITTTDGIQANKKDGYLYLTR
jgi:gliding motility-associated-like protein/uncharacterized repeat protein (TIGR01451 family)